jgi:hypothetical protein
MMEQNLRTIGLLAEGRRARQIFLKVFNLKVFKQAFYREITITSNRITPPKRPTTIMHPMQIQNLNRAAMALNNIGVSLLERGMFRDAMATFKDAVKIHTEAMMAASSKTLCTTEHCLKMASKRMLKVSTKGTKQQRSFPIRLVACSMSDLPNIARIALEEGPTASQAFAVRVEDFDLENGPSLESDLKSAILLLNLAASLLCWGQAAKCPVKQYKLIKSAMKIFAASHAVLIARQTHCMDTDSSNTLLFIEALVLCNLVQLSSTLSDRTTSTALYDKFVQLRDIMYEELDDYCQPVQMHTAAAA